MIPREFLDSVAEQVGTMFTQFLRVSTIYPREWLLGPHGPKENRGVLGKLGLFLMKSRLWERMFLAYILFNTILKLTWRRDLSCTYEVFLNTMALWACLSWSSEFLFTEQSIFSHKNGISPIQLQLSLIGLHIP